MRKEYDFSKATPLWHNHSQEWFDEHKAELTPQYDGEWVTVYKSVVIDHDECVSELLRRFYEKTPDTRDVRDVYFGFVGQQDPAVLA